MVTSGFSHGFSGGSRPPEATSEAISSVGTFVRAPLLTHSRIVVWPFLGSFGCLNPLFWWLKTVVSPSFLSSWHRK